MTWSPDPAAFIADLEAKPDALRSLADVLASDPWPVDPGRTDRVVLLGMGSSRFAALAVAARLRARGIDAVAEYASARSAHRGGSGTLAIAISASGSTAETVEALARHAVAGSATFALTNGDGSALERQAGHHVRLLAGQERGGVACRTFQHTLVRLLQLEAQLFDERSSDVATWARRAAEATEDLLASRPSWLPGATELLTATGTTFLLGPHERLANAEQGALMLREGPRLHADACETSDWLHVDVYLTKTLDYRAMLFPGSSADAEAMRWMRDRDARVLVVGGAAAGAAQVLRFRGDDDPVIALLAEVAVPELVAAERWRRG
jgi:fructoselysine-6-P-deglycase FrlB-like protein